MQSTITLSIALSVALATLVAPHASAASIDINPLPGMPNAPGSPVRAASQVTNQFLGQGVLLSSNGGYVAVVKGVGVHWFQSTEFQNGLGGTNAAGQLSYISPVIFTFVDPSSPSTAWATTSFSLYTDYSGVGAQCSLIAYDIDGAVVDSDIKPEHFGVAATGTQYSVSGAGIVKVVFQGAGTQAVSNIVFDDPGPACNVECAGDLTGDGQIDGADIASLLAAWGTSGGCPSADFDGDGTVNGADLSVVLAAWGLCP